MLAAGRVGDGYYPPEAIDAYIGFTALGRHGRPDEIAAVVVAFLAGPDAGWVTGENTRVTGGMLVWRAAERSCASGGQQVRVGVGSEHLRQCGLTVRRRDNGLVIRVWVGRKNSYATLWGVTAYTLCEHFCAGSRAGLVPACATLPSSRATVAFLPARLSHHPTESAAECRGR